MVTWKGNASHSRAPRRRNSSPLPSGAPDRNQHLDTGEALHDTADPAGEAEATLAPDEAGAGESQADRAERLQADFLVVEAILEQGLRGSRHEELDRELIRYAVPVLRQQMRTGEIIGKCWKLGRPASDSGAWLDFTETDRDELARDMVADALPVFTRAVFERRDWLPAGGASLKTYFVNGCILQFPAAERQWLKARRARPVGLEVNLSGRGTTLDTAATVANHDEAGHLLKEIEDPQLREVLARRAIGYTAKDAARLAGLTEKAAEGRLARMRSALKNRPEPPSDPQGDTSQEGRWVQ